MFDLDLPGLRLRSDTRVLTLSGPSGCGKTTLLRRMLGFLPGGRVIVGDRDMSRGQGFGWVPQDVALLPHLSVEANIRFGGGVMDGIALFDLQPLLQRRVRFLSGGERQRVAMARALACAPHCLLLDEAFSALDSDATARYSERLMQRREHIVLVAHVRDALRLQGSHVELQPSVIAHPGVSGSASLP